MAFPGVEAGEVGVSRQTVRKYAQLEDCLPTPPARVEMKSKLDPFKRLVDQWPDEGLRTFSWRLSGRIVAVFEYLLVLGSRW